MTGFLSGLLAIIGCGKPAKIEYKVEDIYRGLRQQALGVDPIKLGLNSSNQMWGVLMETGTPEAVVSLVTIADGTVSLYFSAGGGIIGHGQHDGPRKAGLDLLSAAPSFLQHAKVTTDFPLPEPGHTRFYFMTREGILTVDSIENDLGNNRSPLSPLFYKAQEVITQSRLAEDERKRSAGKKDG